MSPRTEPATVGAWRQTTTRKGSTEATKQQQNFWQWSYQVGAGLSNRLTFAGHSVFASARSIPFYPGSVTAPRRLPHHETKGMPPIVSPTGQLPARARPGRSAECPGKRQAIGPDHSKGMDGATVGALPIQDDCWRATATRLGVGVRTPDRAVPACPKMNAAEGFAMHAG